MFRKRINRRYHNQGIGKKPLPHEEIRYDYLTEVLYVPALNTIFLHNSQDHNINMLKYDQSRRIEIIPSASIREHHTIFKLSETMEYPAESYTSNGYITIFVDETYPYSVVIDIRS